jgi:hypothetical protein
MGGARPQRSSSSLIVSGGLAVGILMTSLAWSFLELNSVGHGNRLGRYSGVDELAIALVGMIVIFALARTLVMEPRR